MGFVAPGLDRAYGYLGDKLFSTASSRPPRPSGISKKDALKEKSSSPCETLQAAGSLPGAPLSVLTMRLVTDVSMRHEDLDARYAEG